MSGILLIFDLFGGLLFALCLVVLGWFVGLIWCWWVDWLFAFRFVCVLGVVV